MPVPVYGCLQMCADYTISRAVAQDFVDNGRAGAAVRLTAPIV